MRRHILRILLLLAMGLPLTGLLLAPDLAAQAKTPAKSSGKSGKKDAASGPAWAIVKAEDAYVLRYGETRSPDPVFAAACQPAADLLQITLEVASTKIKAGDGVAVALVAGRRRLELAATAFRGAQPDHLVVEAAVMLEARVLDLFEAGDTLVITMPGVHETLPLAGAKGRLADFRRVCLSRSGQ